MDHLDKLENKSIFILREAYANFKNLAMLWSVGKDSTVLVHLARKAFFGNVPFPLVHIDTNFKIPEMIKYRNDLSIKWKLNMIYGINKEAIQNKNTFPDNKINHIECCKLLKTQTLKNILEGIGKRYKMNHETKEYEEETQKDPYTGLILGIRADEEGSRSKERYFSPRGLDNDWNIIDQPPEFWNQYNTEVPPKTHVRIHPLLDWTELNIWEYIQKENIYVVSLYFNQGNNKRYRSLGCAPCTKPIDSTASNVQEIIAELKTGQLSNVAERSGRAQDKEDCGGLEILRTEGYM